MPLSLQEQITKLRGVPLLGKYFASAFQNIEDGINNLGSHVAADPTGTIPAPAPLASVDVAHNAAGLVHVGHTDNQQTQKGVNYFTEVDTHPSFPNPQVYDHGTSRNLPPFTLPNGTYYFRGYHQFQGSMPSTPVNFGGDNPTAVTIAGSSVLPLIPSKGSGTASPDGKQGGWGFGKTLYRGPLGPKRTSGR